jgi:hypothetical protein
MPGTTADLLAAVKRKTFLPSNQATLTDADLLGIANEEMLGYMLPNILSTSAEFFKSVSDNTVVAGQVFYPIPPRSIGSKLAGVYLVDGSLGTDYRVPIVEFDEYAARNNGGSNFYTTVAYVRSNKIGLNPVPVGAGTLRMLYYARPGDLVTTASALQVVSSTATTIVLSSDGGDIGLTTGVPFDVISQNSPFPFHGLDLSGTVTTTTISAITTPADTVVNDWVALAGQSPIPMIPYELHPVLYERTAARVFAILGDTNAYQLGVDRASRLEEQALRIINPRVDDTVRHIVSEWGPRYAHGLGRFPWPSSV